MADATPPEEEFQELDEFHVPSVKEVTLQIRTELRNQVELAVAAFQALGSILRRLFAEQLKKIRELRRGSLYVDLATAARAFSNSFTETPVFRHFAEKAFDEVDFDGDGHVNASEVYCMVLLLYMKMQSSARVNPPSKQHVIKMVRHFDKDKNGTLDREEFLLLATVLGQNLALRVAAELVVKVVLAPVIGMRIVSLLVMPLWSRLPMPALVRRRLANPLEYFTGQATAVFIGIVTPVLISSIDSATTNRRNVQAIQKTLSMVEKSSEKLQEKVSKKLDTVVDKVEQKLLRPDMTAVLVGTSDSHNGQQVTLVTRDSDQVRWTVRMQDGSTMLVSQDCLQPVKAYT